jgi:DNA-binding NtrC family response regulator
MADDQITLEALPASLTQAAAGDPVHELCFGVGTPLAEIERKMILLTLEHQGGDKKLAAEKLGICLKTLYNRLNQYGAD